MSELLVYCKEDEILEVIGEFLLFEELACSVRRLASLDELASIEEALGLVLLEETSNRKTLDMAQKVREGDIHCALPILVMLHDLSPYLKTICHDMEFVLPCSFPVNSADLVPGLKKIIFFSRKRQHALKLREQIARLFKASQFAEALAVIEHYAEEGKDAFRGHLLKSKALLAMGKLKSAADAALAAVHENKNSLEARMTLATVYQAAGLIEKSFEVLNKSIVMAPKYPRFVTMLGLMALDTGNLEMAMQKLEASLHLDEFQDEARSGLIVAEILSGKIKEAKERVRMASDPKNVARYAQIRVLDLAKASRFNEAEKLLETMIKIIPDQKDAYKVWMNLGLQAKKEGDLTRAEQSFKAAQALAPKEYKKAQDQLERLKAS